MNKKLLTSISASTCLALSLMANSTENLGEISVIDTAFEAQVKSITSEKLENLQASDIKDILKSLPSVIVDGNARYSQKVYVRGLEDKSSNITIDGARMTGQLFHHSGDQTIDAEMLKVGSIELGPNSALSGPGVINGAFIYETKDPSDFLKEGEKFGGKISAGYESGFERKKASVAVFSKVNEKLEFVGIGNIMEDGEIHVPTKVDVKSKESKLKSGLVKVIIKPNEYNTIKLSYNKYTDGGDRQLSGEKPGSDNGNNPYNEIVRDTYTLNYEYNPNSDLVKVDAKVYSNTQQLNRDAFTEDYFPTRGQPADGQIKHTNRTYENKAVGFDLRNTSVFGNHILTYGVDYSNEEQTKKADGLATIIGGTKNGQTVNETVDGKGEVKAYGFYVDDEVDLDRVVLNIGARYDIHKMGGIYSGSFKQFSPKFKSSFQANDNLKLRAAYGRIFKGPALAETLTLSNDTTQANSKAQTGHNFEAGFDYDLSESLNADNSIFGFTAYTYNVDNYMHPTKNNSLKPQSDVRIWGLETVFKYSKDALSLSASHTYTDGDDKSIENGVKADPRTAKIHTFKLGVDYKVSPALFLNYNSEFVPGNKYTYRDGSDLEQVKRKGFGVHNVNATYKLSMLKGAKINFGIDNIFDKKYTRHTAFGTYFGNEAYEAYEVGRNVKVNLSYRF